MKLYYTTNEGNLQKQSEPANSLGGYVSSTQVLNGTLHSIFGEIKPGTQVRALAIKNTTGSPVLNARVFVQNYTASPLTLYRFALVAITPDERGCLKVEEVANGTSLPLTGSFLFANGESNAALLPATFDTDAHVALWIERRVNAASLASSQTCESLFAEYSEEDEVMGSVEITIPNNTANILNGKTITIHSENGTYVIYFDDGTASFPETPSDWYVFRIPISSEEASATIAAKIKTELDATVVALDEADIDLEVNKLTWRMRDAGEFSPTTSTEAGVTIVNNQGSTSQIISQEDPVITISWD